MTKFLNISTDTTLGGNSPSNETVSSQKAIKEYVDSHGGGGSTAIDNLSITQNASLQIQTVGVINSRDSSTAVKTWTGTKAQYDAIVTKDPNTLYNITDDTDVSLSLLETLYPIGSIYITTASTCPLSTLISGSTWTLQSSGIVTSVNTNVPIKGTGKTLGLTKGSNNYGLVSIGSYFGGRGTAYGGNVGTVTDHDSLGTNVNFGVTTDDSKSGIVGTVTRSTLSVNIFERTA